jgi:hypothetical protein
VKFGSAIVKSVKADIHKKEITISFSVDLNYMGEAQELAHYMGEDKSDVSLEITPRQLQLINTLVKEKKE